MTNLRWPLPALLTWGTSWLFYLILQNYGFPDVIGLLVATGWGLLLTKTVNTTMRRAMMGLGFPVSLLISSGGVNIPPLYWLLLLAAVVLVYPRKAWGDAPLFPTPKKALRDVPEHAPLLADARILDAGSGLGDGLIALRDAYPRASLQGLEMSWPLRFLSALRCPWARIRQGDIWQADWRDYDMVYMFQRPETMPRAVEKAGAELRPGAWLVSLEFEARALQADAVVYGEDGRPVWLYQQPFKPKA